MTGQISYPRTGGRGGARLAAIRRRLRALTRGGPTARSDAARVTANLEAVSKAITDHAAMVKLAVEVRNALFIASSLGAANAGQVQRALRVCADHWKAANPIDRTALSPLVDQVVAAAGAATTIVDRRTASEMAGVAAVLREVSGLLGTDLGALHASATAIAGTAYREARDVGGHIRFLECGAAYNVNIVIRLDIPGASEPMVVVCEAKGGASGYGSANVPVGLRKALGAKVSQRSPDYAVTRAHHMSRDRRSDAIGQARRDAGVLILDANNSDTLTYVAVRGTIETGDLSSKMEVLG